MEQGTSNEYYEVEGGGHYLVPFERVAAVRDGVLDPSGNYASLIERALMLSNPTSCVQCDNVATPWMDENYKTCDATKWLISSKCVDDPNWVTNGYCRLSCYDAGKGYDANQVCCPPCTECTDEKTPWMANNEKTCATSPDTIETNCYENGWWASNNYCQQSCFDAGRGYEGIECCV